MGNSVIKAVFMLAEISKAQPWIALLMLSFWWMPLAYGYALWTAGIERSIYRRQRALIQQMPQPAADIRKAA